MATHTNKKSEAPSGADPKADLERNLRAQLATLTGGLAPDDYARAWWEWYLNIATHPPRQADLARSAYEKMLDSWQFANRAASGLCWPPIRRRWPNGTLTRVPAMIGGWPAGPLR